MLDHDEAIVPSAQGLGVHVAVEPPVPAPTYGFGFGLGLAACRFVEITLVEGARELVAAAVGPARATAVPTATTATEQAQIRFRRRVGSIGMRLCARQLGIPRAQTG